MILRPGERMRPLIAWIARGWLPAMIAGGVLAGLLAMLALPASRSWFSPPEGGVGLVTVANYPKAHDYFSIAVIISAVALGALLLGNLHRIRPATDDGSPRAWSRLEVVGVTAAVAVLMFLLHFHPQLFMDMFHEGEHLTPGFVLEQGGDPFEDIFFLHGLAADGLIEAIVWTGTESIFASRLARAILDSLTLALLVPLTYLLLGRRTTVIVGIILGLCGAAAGILPVFPYYRLLPLMLCVLGLVAYVRSDRSGFAIMALATAGFGLLWSLDVGIYSCMLAAATAIVIFVVRREDRLAILVGVAIALVGPALLLLLLGADLGVFFRDSFLLIPASADAIWSLPAPALPTLESVRSLSAGKGWEDPSIRYYWPLLLYGLAMALSIREIARGEMRRGVSILLVTVAACLLFRSAAGRVGWGHTRFAAIFVGLLTTIVFLEPLVDQLRRGRLHRRVLAGLAGAIVLVLSWFYFELPLTFEYSGKYLTDWRGRMLGEQLVPYPARPEERVRTYPENAEDLEAIQRFADAHSEPDEPILDLSGELAVYFFVERRPALRVPNLAMLSNPAYREEAMENLRDRPPSFVILESAAGRSQHDGIPHRDRIPEIYEWVERHYPVRATAGRFTMGLPATE